MTIFKDGGPEIANAKDFLGYSHPKEMTTTCSRVGFIENLFNLIMDEASSDNGVYATPI